MKRSTVAALLAALLAAPGHAAENRAAFTVSARVLARATLAVLEQPSRLELSAVDVERGYKDVSARYRVSHNGPRGYLLRLEPRIGLTYGVRVGGPSGEFLLTDIDVEIHQPVAIGVHEFALEYRFLLGPAARPGAYPLPLHLAAVPL